MLWKWSLSSSSWIFFVTFRGLSIIARKDELARKAAAFLAVIDSKGADALVAVLSKLRQRQKKCSVCVFVGACVRVWVVCVSETETE